MPNYLEKFEIIFDELIPECTRNLILESVNSVVIYAVSYSLRGYEIIHLLFEFLSIWYKSGERLLFNSHNVYVSFKSHVIRHHKSRHTLINDGEMDDDEEEIAVEVSIYTILILLLYSLSYLFYQRLMIMSPLRE